MKEFFGFGGYSREAEGFLSWQHLVFVSTLMLIMIALAVFLGLKNSVQRRFLRRIPEQGPPCVKNQRADHICPPSRGNDEIKRSPVLRHVSRSTEVSPGSTLSAMTAYGPWIVLFRAVFLLKSAMNLFGKRGGRRITPPC